MTAQIGEKLIYQNQELTMCTEPLGMYFALGGGGPAFAGKCTALWRGYVGTWEIIDNRLYLINLNATLESGEPADLKSFFPDFPYRVFAHWYSGTLRVPEGKQLNYVHMGYGSTYERDLLIEIENGIVTGTSLRKNGEADENAPEGYGVAGMTVFSLDEESDQA